jgi:biopolymer transport protein ExbB/TolQ
MASVKNLKKDINYVLSDIIEECYVWQVLQDDTKKADKAEKIIDQAISTFDELIEKVNTKNVDNKKAHYNAISEDLEKQASALLSKIEKL